MARYATTEKLYKCPLCKAQFAIREAKQIPKVELNGYECPSCDDAYITLTSPNSKVGWWGSQSGELERMLQFHVQL